MGAIPTYRQAANIAGWMSRSDHVVFAAVADLQQNMTGDLLEIGAFEGRSAVILGGMAAGPDRVHICDPFDSRAGDDRNQRESADEYPALQRATFDQNYARFHESPPIVHQCLSAELELAAGSVRFAHIDGSHLYENIVHDIALVRRAVVPGAIVAFDDYRKQNAPGVSAAVWQAVSEGLVPIIMTSQKLYGAWAPPPIESVQAALDAHGCITRPVPFQERPIIYAAARLAGATRALRALTPPALVNRSSWLRQRLT